MLIHTKNKAFIIMTKKNTVLFQLPDPCWFRTKLLFMQIYVWSNFQESILGNSIKSTNKDKKNPGTKASSEIGT